MSQCFKVVAIDGGAATGKSSTSRALAERIGFLRVDTGAHYRTLTLLALSRGIAPGDVESVEDFLSGIELETRIDAGSARLLVDGRVPAEAELRSPEVNAAVSLFASLPEVRAALLEYQRSLVAIARERGFAGIIVEGRDIGSVVLPDADHRFFLEADPQTRAARRLRDGETDSIAKRDAIDSSRKTAPLVCPDGAIRIDTSRHTLPEVVDELWTIITGIPPIR